MKMYDIEVTWLDNEVIELSQRNEGRDDEDDVILLHVSQVELLTRWMLDLVSKKAEVCNGR